MSISCQFEADGAVRRPVSGRFIPQAAQSRSESTFRGNLIVLNDRVDFLSFNESINVLPPSSCGGGSLIGFKSCADSDTVKVSSIAESRIFLSIFIPLGVCRTQGCFFRSECDLNPIQIGF